MLDAHQDTVPVDGMTIPPFEPNISNGRLYGRGSCDVKGGLAAMLSAFARLVREKPAGAANVIMSCTCDEEETAKGAKSLAAMWNDPAQRHPLIPAAPSLIVCAEPTSLDVVTAHRGAVRWKIRTKGRACHSSRPEQGENAIYKMAQIISCLERYAAEVGHMVPVHPLCGSATLSVGIISGGVSVNTVPDECTIEIDRRTLPGEDGHAVLQHVSAYLRERLDVDFENLPPWCHGETLSDDDNGVWADRLLEQIAPVAGPHKKVGVAYGTNASRMVTPGLPAVVFGPGCIDQAHTRDEWIEIAQLDQAAEIYYRFCVAAG
jgi:acetylornithine deacetylase